MGNSSKISSTPKSADDIELQAAQINTDPSLLSFRRHGSRKPRGTSSLAHRGHDSFGTLSSDPDQQLDRQLLMVLRIMGLYRLQHFLIPGTALWNKRRALGQGSSFAVEEASLPVWKALGHETHRQPHARANQAQNSYFTDHTGTSWSENTRVAFKLPDPVSYEYAKKDALGVTGDVDMVPPDAVGDTINDLSELIRELLILCHPPFYNHPHIVQLLGVAWVRQPSVDGVQITDDKRQRLQRDQPTMVTEYASHGSLSQFLRSPAYKNRTISLKTKLRLCVDLLEGMLALRVCGVAHGDIKCENALVYDTCDSTAENWKAKLSDFGNAVVGLNSQPDRKKSMAYTVPNDAPELDGGRAEILASLVEKADVWGWGMLLWCVMIDGKLLEENGASYYWDHERDFYHDSQRRKIDENEMSALKKTECLSSVASRSCAAYLRCTHTPAEIALARDISAILECTLVKDPLMRLSISELLQKLIELHDSPIQTGRGTSLSRAFQAGYTFEEMREPKQVAEMPFFDFTQHHQIKGLPAIVERVRNGLNQATNLHKEESLQAYLQLSLCYTARIKGLDDNKLALKHLLKAASSGLEKAQALVPRFHEALEKPLPEEARTLFLNSSARSTVAESLIASLDLIRIDYQAYKRVAKMRARDWNEVTLLRASRIGDLEAAEVLISRSEEIEYGRSGETALHWLALLPCDDAKRLVDLLLKKNWDPNKATTRQTKISDYPHYLRTMPPGTTSLHWALESDNQRVFQTLLKGLEETEIITDLLCTAARYQSSECLSYLCRSLKVEEHVDVFDSRGFSPLYYAICSDATEQILRFTPGPGYKSHKERYLAVIKSLLDQSETMRVSRYDNFNIVHLAAALDTPDVLNLIASHGSLTRYSSTTSLTDLVNRHDHRGMAPINAAIAQGVPENLEWLLAKGANPNHVNSNFAGHAIHLCAMNPGDNVIDFAEKLVKRDPRCVHLRTAWGLTPLHHAACYGHTALAKFLIEKGANLTAHSGGTMSWRGNATPLGCAISSRSFSMVKFMCEKLMGQQHPLYAHAWIGQRGDALQYLLRPGTNFFSDHLHDNGIFPWDKGCYDHPFSLASQRILDYLIKIQPESHLALSQRIMSWLRMPFSIGSFQMDPIHWAVRMANIEAFEKLANTYKGDYRDLLAVAHRQLLLGRTHVAGEEVVVCMIEELRARQSHHYEEWLEQHDPNKFPNPLSRFYTTYRRKYVVMEQQQYERAMDWMNEHRLNSRPAMLELRDAEQWFPGYCARFALIWAILIPTIVSLIVSWLDPTAKFEVSYGIKAGCMVFLTNINVIWLKMIRITTVLYSSKKSGYPAIDPKLTGIQMCLCVLAMALSVLQIWMVHIDTDFLIRYSYFSRTAVTLTADGDLVSSQECLPRTLTALEVIYNTTNCLIAYTVIAQVTFQIYIFLFLCNRWKTFGTGPEFNRNRLPPVDNWAGRYALSTRYGITVRSFARPYNLGDSRLNNQDLTCREYCI